MSKIKVIELGVHGIVVHIGTDDSDRQGGQIRSEMHVGGAPEDAEYNAAIDGIESMILAHACAGIDITTAAYKEGIETSVDACANNF
jgi:hypothetical protein